MSSRFSEYGYDEKFFGKRGILLTSIENTNPPS